MGHAVGKLMAANIQALGQIAMLVGTVFYKLYLRTLLLRLGPVASIGYQSDLACLYCPDLIPYDNKFKLGRFARHWWEEAAAQKLPCGMLGLAKCLRCGKCHDCNRDIPRAKALEAEADEIERKRER